ncbi:MAG TPA: NO-inducible flavohemoprotein [Verrucomicrobiales bacterium]|jgi:nitric oxide dioxygenase|nr:NO-inducible flavohemoprotein [Verrucomicrobiales bacterium]
MLPELSAQTIAIVKSTAPILEEHGELLTRHFYKRMFQHNPEVAPFFNQANQGAGLQQRALAAAICAYAANIDNLEVLGGAVELIAQKHASLQIKPEHYPIVGANLLASIQEVLGAGATEEVINAWAEAYQFLAAILIGREAQIYHEHRTAANGWEGFKPFFVTRKEPESETITSFYLEPVDASSTPDFKPGQYITLRVPSPCGHSTMRNYSLSDKPGNPWYRISVKRETGGGESKPDGFVSNFLHQHVRAGDRIEVGPPCGEFFLDPSEQHRRPLVLLSAGVGITPVMSMLLSALERTPERQILFLHGCLNSRVHAFRQRIDALAKEHPNLTVVYRYDDPTEMDRQRMNGGPVSEGQIDAELIESLVPGRDADYYFCGPKPFMVNIYHQLLAWGIPASQAHFEFFGPRQDLEKPRAVLTKCPV